MIKNKAAIVEENHMQGIKLSKLPEATVEKECIKVAVRVRPLIACEMKCRPHLVLSVSQQRGVVALQRSIVQEAECAKSNWMKFQFDYVFWSLEGAADESGPSPATQADVFMAIGLPLVQHAFNGFNSCLFAYGQTGSGKTHTMMGANVHALDDEGGGVTPRVCLEMFRRKAAIEVEGHALWSVKLGYVEVYNERVSDLLAKRRKGAACGEEVFVEVREHPKQGVFIEGQQLVAVNSPEEVMRCLEAGNAVRHTATTKINERSSRSHAIVTLLLREERTMTTKSGETITTVGKRSRMNLVDLAGSERVGQSDAEGMRFTEATHINLSLTTLGRVIGMLAERAANTGRSQWSTPPYRESKLTFILRDSLGGNSKTFMVATVSPSALNFEETLSTLRYASRARDVVNTAHINEDPRARRIRELEEQMVAMRCELQSTDPSYVSELEARLALMESEAQKRAADLQALEKEREQHQLQGRMLKATEAEKAELASQAVVLQRQVDESRRQAAEMQAQNLQLMEEQAQKEKELRDALERESASLSMIRRCKNAEIESVHDRLAKAMTALEKERGERERAMIELEQHHRRLEDLFVGAKNSAADCEALRTENAMLLENINRLMTQFTDSQNMLNDFHRVQCECNDLKVTNAALKAALGEMEERHHATVFFFITMLDLLTQCGDQLCAWMAAQQEEALAQCMQQASMEIDQLCEQVRQLERKNQESHIEVQKIRMEMLNSNILLNKQLQDLHTAKNHVDSELSRVLSDGKALLSANGELERQLHEAQKQANASAACISGLELAKRKYEIALNLEKSKCEELRIRLNAHQRR